MPQIGWQLPGLPSKNKEMKKCAWSGCLQWIYISRPKKGKSPQQPDKFYTWKNWKGCIWIFIFIERCYVFFFFSIWPQKVPNHSTYDNTFKRRQIWVLARTFTHNVFYKGVQHVKLPADSQKASHTRLQTQLGRLVKSYGSWCLCWSSQKVISSQVCYNKNKK